MIDAIASAQIQWPNTETRIVLVCRVVLPQEKYGANEFLDKDGRVCRWVVEAIKKENNG